MKAIIYSRVSTAEQKEHGFSLQDQEIRLRRYCSQQGYEVVVHYQDDASAKDFVRPAFQKMISDLVHKKIKADKFVCINANRFSRNTEAALVMLRTLKKLGVDVEYSDSSIDSSTPHGRLVQKLEFVMAEFDNDEKGARTRAGLRLAMRNGRWVNNPPRGYSKGIEKGVILQNEKAKFVREAFEEVAKGVESIEAIRLKLGRKDFRVPKSSFHHMLTNPVYIGNILIKAIEGEPEKIVKGLHDPIISDELFRQVQDVVNGRKKVNIRRGTQDSSLPLRGHLICHTCGKKLTGSASKNRTKNKYYYYHCQYGCKTRYNAEVANELFIDFIESFSVPKEIANLYYKVVKDVFREKSKSKENELRLLDKELAKLKERENSADDKFIDNLIDSSTYNRIKKQYQDRSNEVHGRILDLKMSMNDFELWAKTTFRTIPNLAKRFRSAGIEVQHKILCSIFPGNLVYDGNKYRTQRLNEVFALICNKDKDFGMAQKKQTDKNDGLSNQAPHLGLEPRTL
ncbi:MAG: recombinase family protein [Bacteroidetes bacterium]|nr:recombinase family protein [Bacteroidota bacterium]